MLRAVPNTLSRFLTRCLDFAFEPFYMFEEWFFNEDFTIRFLFLGLILSIGFTVLFTFYKVVRS